MGYGDVTSEDGREIQENGTMPTLTGEQVKGNEIVGLEFPEFQGVVSRDAAILTFKQANGAYFKHRINGMDAPWAIDQTKREMMHICSKIVPREEYQAAIAGSAGFVDFINRVKNSVIPKAAGKKFTLKIVYKLSKDKTKAYINFPNFPNFIELDGTEPTTLSTNPKYDIYEMPSLGTPETTGAPMPGAEVSDAPF